jgi:hypothetical protein
VLIARHDCGGLDDYDHKINSIMHSIPRGLDYWGALDDIVVNNDEWEGGGML